MKERVKKGKRYSRSVESGPKGHERVSPEVRKNFEDLLEAGTNAEYHFFRPAVYSSSALN